MKSNNDLVAGFDWRRSDRTGECGNWARDLAIALAFALIVLLLGMIGDARAQQAQRVIQIAGSNRTAMVTVAIGKSQDVRTDASFVDIMVGDPDVADVNPLTDHSLST